MMRSSVCGASWVCSVANTRWPVSAAVIAVRDRLEVAHLADQDHVRVLAQRGLQRVGEAGRVRAELALVDDALLVLVEELDRVLDRHDVLFAVWLMTSISDASVVDLPEPVGPVTSTSPRGLLREVGDDRRQPERLERQRPRTGSGGTPRRAPSAGSRR